jgi:hypothetical protein
MKINTILLIFVIIACILIAGYDAKSFANIPTEKSTLLQTNSSLPDVSSSTGSQQGHVLTNANQGQIFISIGRFNASLPVFIDNTKFGMVSNGQPLGLVLNEGNHTVSVCAGTICDTTAVNIKSAIKTTVDFEDLLNKNMNQGSVNVSIGKYDILLPVFIDDSIVGNVSSDKPLSQIVSTGLHSVKTCIRSDYCFTKDVEIESLNETTVDFGDQLENQVKETDLTVSIGGYNAKLPVVVDNVSVGFASHGNPLTIKVFEGAHDVQVCSGVVCENRQVETYFGKMTVIDFGEQLLKDAEFTAPTVQIIDSSMNGFLMVVNIEFINPDKIDHDISVTVNCQYTYIDPDSKTRMGDSATGQLTKSVKSGSRIKGSLSLYMPGGPSSSLITSVPVISDITIT